MSSADADAVAERKRKRLEAWRKRQQQQQSESAAPAAPAPPPPPAVKVKMSLGGGLMGKKLKKKKPKKKIEVPKLVNPFQDDDDELEANNKPKPPPPLDFELGHDADDEEDSISGGKRARSAKKSESDQPKKRRKRSSRWDQTGDTSSPANNAPSGADDALDKFMEKLEAGALGTVATQQSSMTLSIDVSGSMTRLDNGKTSQEPLTPVSGGVITADQLAHLSHKSTKKPGDALYTHSDWESDAHAGSASEPETDEDEETARRSLIEALKSAPTPAELATTETDAVPDRPAQLAAEVKTEKHRREERLKDLEKRAESARLSAEAAAAPEFGRLYNDAEGGVMEEAERNLDAAMAAPDALEVLAELNKKKELKAVDHSKVDYIPFKKNLYIVPRALASLTHDEVTDRRAKMKVKVRGKGAPAPVSSFQECGLSERVLQIMEKQDITTPFPVQAQCLPCIMAGRDVIGIAKTGSGKTLAYLLPLLRHIADQPPLESNESGPIGLILAPARELATQIHAVCKQYTKHLGLKATAVYGGAGVAEQIGDLKRGTHIVVATPGRLIDILTMQSGKILSLKRVSYVVMDEADRLFDMGFAPQLSAILAAVRPDRQTVLFSATFPKVVEALARKSLKYPIEVIVGGRSVASDSVTQYAELVEEEDKFLRLLQLLGEHVESGKKVIVFVDTQVKADSIFEQLLRCGYVSLSLHGGKEQDDRDSTISDFKRKDGPGVLVATGVAGRGLDVPSCGCVINYSAPNHLEAYVHQVGRTGRSRKLGFSYTFVSSTDEAKFAPIVVRALSEAGQSENISPELKKLSDSFKEKVEKGEARYAGSGFKGKGYSYDSTELSDAQKLARLEKREALIEAGLIDADDEDPALASADRDRGEESRQADGESKEVAKELQTKLSAELLSLPGMQQAILKKAGIIPEDENTDDPSMGRPVQMGPNHYLQEFEINDYPREARWKVTQKETTSRLQDEFQTAVTLKGVHIDSSREPKEGERKLYLHLEATSERILGNCVQEIRRLLNEETLRVGAKGLSGRGSSHKYNVLGGK